MENSNIVDIKSIISEHPKKVEKVCSNSSFYSDAKKRKHFLNEKNVKITKREHALKAKQVLIILKF